MYLSWLRSRLYCGEDRPFHNESPYCLIFTRGVMHGLLQGNIPMSFYYTSINEIGTKYGTKSGSCPIYDVLSDVLQSNRVKHTHARTLVHDTINGSYSQTLERSRVLCWINVREYRRGNTIWTIQRNWILVGAVCGSELAQGNLTTFRQYLLWT